MISDHIESFFIYVSMTSKTHAYWCYSTEGLVGNVICNSSMIIIGGSRGGREGRTPPPGRPNSFDFMQFSGKFGVFTPPLEGSRPPLGKILDPPLIMATLITSLPFLLMSVAESMYCARNCKHFRLTPRLQ